MSFDTNVEIKICKKCVNYLELKSKVIECDYDMFPETPIEKAKFFVPEEFNCTKYEDKEKL